jgi:hypothetical protein
MRQGDKCITIKGKAMKVRFVIFIFAGFFLVSCASLRSGGKENQFSGTWYKERLSLTISGSDWFSKISNENQIMGKWSYLPYSDSEGAINATITHFWNEANWEPCDLLLISAEYFFHDNNTGFISDSSVHNREYGSYVYLGDLDFDGIWKR